MPAGFQDIGDTVRQLTRLPRDRPLFDATYLPVPPDVALRYPYPWVQTIGGRTYGFEVDYNDVSNIWTLAIYQGGRPIVIRPLRYAIDCVGRFQHYPELRGLHIVPFDGRFRWLKVGITKDNFATEVKLYFATELPPIRGT